MGESKKAIESTKLTESELESNSVPARVASPCVSICLLDEDDICTGCYRSGAEIRGWVLMSDAERLAVVASARQRAKVGNPFAAD